MVIRSNAKRPIEATIKLYLHSQEDGGDVVSCLVERDRKLKRALMSYCDKKNLDYEAMVFLHNGKKVADMQTPDEMGIEDGDSIDVMMHQIGGGYLAGKNSTSLWGKKSFS